MVVADEIKVADDDAKDRDIGFVWTISEKRRMRWSVFRRAVIAYIPFPCPPQYLKPGQPALELTQASSLFVVERGIPG